MENQEQPAGYANILKSSGLTQRESFIYEMLLKNGQMGVQPLLKLVPYNRTNLYDILYTLRDKGLIEQTVKNKKIEFKPKDPQELTRYVLEQKNRYDRAESMLTSVMPALSEMYKMTTEKPAVRVYEGYEGIKTIYEDTLREGKPIVAFLEAAESDTRVWKWLRDHYVKKRVEQKIPAKVLVSMAKDDPRASEYTAEDKSELRETKIVDKKEFPCKLEIQIYGNKVSFANYNKGDALVGVIIDNKNIAVSMKSLFNQAWDRNTLK